SRAREVCGRLSARAAAVSESFDVIVVGGGPVGLAAAIEARKHGVSVVVLERQMGDVDKACGEGLMPSGVHWLEANGVLQKLTSAECRRFVGIRYVSETGTVAEGKLPGVGGLGVRRLALSRAMRVRAREMGVVLREGVSVQKVERSADGVTVHVRRSESRNAHPPGDEHLDDVRQSGRSESPQAGSEGIRHDGRAETIRDNGRISEPGALRDNGRPEPVRDSGESPQGGQGRVGALDRTEELLMAKLVIGADGLHSRVRAYAGLEVDSPSGTRFGMRRHFHVKPWSEFVEVHFGDGVEAYVTPVGEQNVGIAFLWSKIRAEGVSYDELLARFPELERRVRGATMTSSVRGAGPLLQRVSRPVADRLVLIGDAAGYVDAITGEGLTLGFHCAELLGAVLPRALAQGATVDSLHEYERSFRKLFDRYAWLTQSLLEVAKRPSLRRAILKLLSMSPGLFEAALSEAMPQRAA
ncbi:MAG: NAD(P)/FAD-dependent oxidoreductase, partial [Myxococcaceae bacterium]